MQRFVIRLLWMCCIRALPMGECFSRIADCTEYTTTGRCRQCLEHFTVNLSNGKCQACPPHCVSCDADDTRCDDGGCESQYGLIGGYCQAMSFYIWLRDLDIKIFIGCVLFNDVVIININAIGITCIVCVLLYFVYMKMISCRANNIISWKADETPTLPLKLASLATPAVLVSLFN